MWERYYVLIETWRKQQQQFTYATEAEALARYGQSARAGDNRGDVWDFSYEPARHIAHFVRD